MINIYLGYFRIRRQTDGLPRQYPNVT